MAPRSRMYGDGLFRTLLYLILVLSCLFSAPTLAAGIREAEGQVSELQEIESLSRDFGSKLRVDDSCAVETTLQNGLSIVVVPPPGVEDGRGACGEVANTAAVRRVIQRTVSDERVGVTSSPSTGVDNKHQDQNADPDTHYNRVVPKKPLRDRITAWIAAGKFRRVWHIGPITSLEVLEFESRWKRRFGADTVVPASPDMDEMELELYAYQFFNGVRALQWTSPAGPRRTFSSSRTSTDEEEIKMREHYWQEQRHFENHMLGLEGQFDFSRGCRIF